MKIAAVILTLSAMAAPGLAEADSSISVNLSAHVDVFCHIYPPQGNDIAVVSGRAQIGAVKEICNTPDGYEVSTTFSNLSAGKLEVGDAAYIIDSHGSSVRDSDQPAVRTLSWSLQGAQLASASSPVIMKVTISPR